MKPVESKKFYDVVVLGSGIEQLACAALLCKQGFRVLVVGQKVNPPSYNLLNTTLPAAPTFFPSGDSPAVKEILKQLAMIRPTVANEGYFHAIQFAFPHHRMDFSTDGEELRSEFKREFPYEHMLANEILHRAKNTSQKLDEIFSSHFQWPPSNLRIKYKFKKQSQQWQKGKVFEADLAASHPIKVLFQLPALFFSGVEKSQISEWAQARCVAQLMHKNIDGFSHKDQLHAQLTEKVRSLGGTVLMHEKATQIRLQKRKIEHVYLAELDGLVACHHVVVGISWNQLTGLFQDETLPSILQTQYDEPKVRFHKYTLNLGVHESCISRAIESQLFIVRDLTAPLSNDNVLHLEIKRTKLNGTPVANVCVQVLVSRAKVEDTHPFAPELRKKIIQNLESVIPFLREHLIWAHSPHDDLPLEIFQKQWESLREFPAQDRIFEMEPVYSFERYDHLQMFVLPPQTSLKNLFFCTSQVVPGLGLEGRMLLARSVARAISRQDNRAERKRKSLWSKIPS